MKKLQAFLRSSAIIITTNGDKHKSTVSENRIFVVSFVRITHPVFVINDVEVIREDETGSTLKVPRRKTHVIGG